jgi:hypothetical protein
MRMYQRAGSNGDDLERPEPVPCGPCGRTWTQQEYGNKIAGLAEVRTATANARPDVTTTPFIDDRCHDRMNLPPLNVSPVTTFREKGSFRWA